MSSFASHMSKADKVLANVAKEEVEWNNLPDDKKATRAGKARARKIAKRKAKAEAGKLREEQGLPEEGPTTLAKNVRI